MSDLEGFELSPQQKRLWPFLALRSDAPYRAQAVVVLDGSLARDVLLACLHSVLDRHEILRTRFRKIPGMSLPLQVMGASDGLLALREVDLPRLDAGERDAALASLLAEEQQTPLDPEQGPVVRVTLAFMEAERTVLVLTLSALCADGPSLSNLIRELADAYAEGGRVPRSDDTPQYADLAAWQNELVELDEASAGRMYWRHQRLDGLETDLPFERRREEPAPFSPATVAWPVAPPLRRRLEALATVFNAPLEDVLLAAWCVLFARHTGAPVLPVGVLSDGRNYETLERAIGPLARYLLVSFEPAAGTIFRSVVETLASLRRKALDYQELFSWEAMSGAHDPTPPYFPLCFDFQPPTEEHTARGLRFSVLRRTACIEPYRLRLSCSAERGGLSAEIHYDSEAFEPSDIEKLAERFTALLESAAKNPDAQVEVLGMLGPSERDLLAVLNDTVVDIPEPVRLERLFEKQVERTPEAIAVVLEERCLTYAELNDHAAKLARYLLQLGVGPEVVVPICVERSIDMVIGLLGILKAGGAYLPLDPGLPSERLSLMLEESGAPVLLTRAHELAVLPPLRCTVVRLDEDWPEPTQEALDPSALGSDHAAYVIYTSGSTGMPKGILVSHRAICNRLLWMERDGLVASSDCLLQRTRFTFDASIWEIFLPLWLGTRLVLLPQEAQADADRLVQLIQREAVTVLQVVPSLLRVLVEEQGLCLCGSLRRVFSGGEALAGDLARQLAECLPQAALVNLYGPTEAAIDATFQPCEPSPERSRIPIGRPLPNVQVYIVDAAVQQVPSEVPGELCIGGIGLARGYVRRADLTSGRFIPSPFGDLPGDRLYRTGDLARRLSDGSIDFLGRVDRQVKLRGYRIELDEIEAVLRQHPDVLQTAVVLRDDVPGHQRLVAYVEVSQQPGTHLASAGELRDFAAARLPEYMVPAAIARLPKLPLLPNGKLDRSALPPPESVRPTTTTEAVAPRNRAEEILVAIWCELLRLDRVSIHDNFFELGGDSILSIQVVARAKRAGIVLVARDVFRHQTIAELAQAAQGTVSHDSESEQSGGPFALSPAQRQFFDLELLEPHHFNQALLLRVDEPIPLGPLTTMVAAVVSHHEALRLRFEPGTEGWLQIASAPGDPPVSCLDLSSLPEPLRRGALEQAVAAVHRSLDFLEGPVFRVVQLDLGTLGSRLLLLAHHLVVDGVSWRILLEDFAVLQEQIQSGKPPDLPPPTTSFRSWIERLIRHVEAGALTREIPYWLALSDVAASPLPTDLDGGENTFGSAQTISVALEPGETRILLQESLAALRAQINDVLLAALARAFTAWTGGHSLLIDIEGHGREELFEDVDLSRTMGWFTSQFPVLLDLAGGDSPEAALHQVKEQLRQVPNRGVGYLLLRYFDRSPELGARMRALPKAQVSFNYLGQIDQSLPPSSRLSLAPEDKGPEIAPSGKRPFLIDVIGVVAGSQLRIQLSYSAHLHRTATIAALGDRFLAELRSLLELSRSGRTEAYVPSEFPLAGLDQNRLGRLSALIDRLDTAAEEGELLDA